MSKALLTCGLLFNLLFFVQQNELEPMPTFDYEKAWKEVAEFEQKDLPTSALAIVNNIYAAAKKEENAGQQIKAVIHQLKFIDYKEEDSFVKNLVRLKLEAAQASFPVKPILHSMLGEMYWQYYQRNRSKFYNRSETVDFDDSDIKTWSLKKIVEETFDQYHLSLQSSQQSKKEKIVDYDLIYFNGNELGFAYRPTLFDFLAHRALGFYTSPEPELTKPAYEFTLNNIEYLADAQRFSELALTSKDELSMKFRALSIYQELIKFHLNDKDPSALVSLDLDRLNFVRSHLTHANTNEVYQKSLEILEGKVVDHPIVGNVTLAIARIFAERSYLYKPLISDEHKWDVKKAIELANKAINRFPESNGAKACFNFKEDLLNKHLQVVIEEQNVPDKPFRALVKYKNINKLHYRIISTSRKEVVDLRSQLNNQRSSDYDKDFISYFTAKSPVQSGSFDLEDDLDYQQHSVEVKIDALDAGSYMILFSHNENFEFVQNGLAYAFTSVTDIAYVHRNTEEGHTEFFVVDRTTGKPIRDVTLKLRYKKYNNQKRNYEDIPIGNYTTDGNGYVLIKYNKNNDKRNFIVDFSKKEDFFSTESIDVYRNGSGSIRQYEARNYDRKLQTFFFLDRKIYRPGQTIYFKGLVIDPDTNEPVIKSNYATTIELKDVNYQTQEKVAVKTNEFGTFSGSFTAPANGLTGQMQINNLDGSGNTYFRVEEYKRPKFYVGFNNLSGEFQLNEHVQAVGYATAYSGAQIDGATVKYRVVRKANFPFWWWCRWGYYPSSPEVEITNGETETDEKGQFKIDFKALPDLTVDPSSDPTFSYQIYADVTDINGETHSSSTNVSIGYKSLKVAVNISTIDLDTLSNKARFSILTTNQSGLYIPAQGHIRINRVEVPARAYRRRLWEQADRTLYTQELYAKYFPNDQYKDENNQFSWKKGQETFSNTFDTGDEKHFQIQDLKSWKTGLYVLEIQSKDKNGQSVKDLSYFKVIDNSSKRITIPTINFYQPEKLTVEPGDDASFFIGSSDPNVKVYYELEHDGRIIDKNWLTLKNEKTKITIPIKEKYRGNVVAHYFFIKDNRKYDRNIIITVPYTNKQLDVSFESFRNKLEPGAKEQWKMIVKGRDADRMVAEMVATLYDQSLDEFSANSFYANFYSHRNSRLTWQSNNGFTSEHLSSYTRDWNSREIKEYDSPAYPNFNWYNYGYRSYRARYGAGVIRKNKVARSSNIEDVEVALDVEFSETAELHAYANESDDSFAFSAASPEQKVINAEEEEASENIDLSQIKVRTNFNETAFFYPHLQTNENGEIIINFTIPEALTTWKMLGFAHTQDLKSGYVNNQLVTQKDLMIIPNQPRFFRENDRMKFSAKISSLVDKELSGTAQLEFFDALTMRSIDDLIKNQTKTQTFSIKAKQSTNVDWEIEIPEGIQAITYRIVAKAGSFSDGEEMILPVVTNRMLVTESLPLPIRGNQTKEFQFDKLLTNKSQTLRHHRYTLEFTSNPAWYAIQSLPYLMEYPYECVEQTFSKFYANSLASHIANSNPQIKRVFDTWKNIQPDALLSNLEKNQELKSALLEETPWVLHAKNENQRKRNVGLLFDLNRMAKQQERSLTKLIKAQSSNGGFSWFPGMPENRYMTQHVITGMGHLDHLGVSSIKTNSKTWEMVVKGVEFLDNEIKRDHDRLLELAQQGNIKLEEKHISHLQFQYLYMRSFFQGVKISKTHQKAFNYYLEQAKKYWNKNTLSIQGMACLALNRYGENEAASDIIKSFNERALHTEEFGMYWKYGGGYYWYQAPIETHALMIEVYQEVAKNEDAVEELKIWLLKQKQTQDWKTTKATVEACYALLLDGKDALASTDLVSVTIGDKLIDPLQLEDTKVEAGTGYFKTAWQGNDVTESMGQIKVSKQDNGIAWGAVYWQYFEQLDKITTAETPLTIKKDLFVQQNSDSGPVIKPINDQSTFNIGDLVKVRVEIRVDRNMEYVHLKDMRAAGFEPVSTLSAYKYQDGLHYYESPRDLSTNFFIGYLPKGTYVFEYDLRASQKGNFSNGITSIQCMYAPEFASHSSGIRVNIE